MGHQADRLDGIAHAAAQVGFIQTLYFRIFVRDAALVDPDQGIEAPQRG